MSRLILELLAPIKDSPYDLCEGDTDYCRICYDNRGFPTLCNVGDPGEHRFCLDCVVQAYKNGHSSKFLCSVCKSPFNIQDYLVVRELHLIHLHSEQSVLDYATVMRNNLLQRSPVEEFLVLEEKYQKKMISKMYWGNNCLFDEMDDYLKDIAKNKRIKENLLEMLDNLWSHEINKEEKDQRLSQIFTNGWLIQPCQNELTETFLHRCHLFLRAVLPLYNSFNKNLLSRIKSVEKFFPEYDSLVKSFSQTTSRLLVVTRPVAGPLDVEEHNNRFCTNSFLMVDWGLLKREQILRNRDLGHKLEEEVCDLCHSHQGFSPLCHGDYIGEHRFCLDCAVNTYKSSMLCPVCRSLFNFQDYLVVRELHLIHSYSDQSILDYFNRVRFGQKSDLNRPYLESFLSSEAKDQKRVISIMYWGNDSLFDGVDNYPKDTKNKRIKENLVEMLGNLWSPRLDTEEKNQQLLEVLTNGVFVKSCKKESKETFLHRCQLFLRAFLPLCTDLDISVVHRIQRVKEFFPEYNNLGCMRYMYLPVVTRPSTGPCDEEPLSNSQTNQSMSAIVDWRNKYRNCFSNLNQ